MAKIAKKMGQNDPKVGWNGSVGGQNMIIHPTYVGYFVGNVMAVAWVPMNQGFTKLKSGFLAAPNLPLKMGKMDQKWLSMTKTCHFWVMQMVQIRPGISTQNYLTNNGKILMKNWVGEIAKKWPKLLKNGPKWVKMGHRQPKSDHTPPYMLPDVGKMKKWIFGCQ